MLTHSNTVFFLSSREGDSDVMLVGLKAIIASVALAVFVAPANAQWPPYPTKNVPRNEDGSPNMKAPTPRAADGHPDLTGLWEIYFNSIAPPPAPGQASPSR